MSVAGGGIVSVADDLSRSVNAGRLREHPAGARRNQIVEILQFATAVNEGMILRGAIVVQHVSRADHHPGGVDRLSDAGVEEDPEVGHLAATVEKRVHRAVRGRGVPHDLAGIVDGVGRAARASQGAEIGHSSVVPQERVVDVGETLMTRRAPLCDRS